MSVAALVDGLTITDVVLLLGFAAVILDRVSDARGWSRSSKNLRRENEDLVRINTELEKTVTALQQKVSLLEAKVSELQLRDQEAVLRALERHETQAAARNERITGVLERIAANLEERRTP